MCELVCKCTCVCVHTIMFVFAFMLLALLFCTLINSQLTIFFPDDSIGISSGFEVIERGTIGRAFRLFNNIKITLDGYLIGWKYYYKKVDSICTTNSHVTVFGKRDSNSNYGHITSTLLQPESFLESGIRVQFVQKDLLPVQRNDLLGLYTVNCGSTAKHVVSGANDNANTPKHAFKQASVTLAGVEALRINSFTDSQKLRVSLQAFVAGL